VIGVRRPSVRLSVCLMSRTSALTRKPKGLGRRNFAQGYPRSHTIRYDRVYLSCSKKLTGSQLSLPHGINKKLKCETKNKKIMTCQ